MNTIVHGNIFRNGKFERGYLCFGDRIERFSLEKPQGTIVFSDPDAFVVPGFIDIHTNGAVGVDFSDAQSSNFNAFSTYCYTQGVTCTFPTIISSSLETTLAALKKLVATDAPGIHLEGPFISHEKKGAHTMVLAPDLAFMKAVRALIPSHVHVLLTVAPEIPGIDALVQFARDQQWTVSAGHTTMDFATATKACENGIRGCTHLFNAMSSLHHRKGGCGVAYLLHDDAFVQLIPDGIHVAPEMLALIKRVKKPEKIIVVTDNLPMTGLPDGEYRWPREQRVIKQGNVAMAGDLLAGSVVGTQHIFTTLLKAGFSLEEIVTMRTTAPAAFCQLQDVGALNPGFKADIALFSQNLELLKAFKNGELVFDACRV